MTRGAKVARTRTEMMDAAWQWGQERFRTDGTLLQLSLYPTERRGVWRCSARVLEQVDGKPWAVRLQVAEEWPNSRAATLEAFVFQLLTLVDVREEEMRMRERAGATF